MKCTVCPNRPVMEEKHEGTKYFWVCPQCKKIVGKEEEKKKEE